jgi:hypothetical protein
MGGSMSNAVKTTVDISCEIQKPLQKFQALGCFLIAALVIFMISSSMHSSRRDDINGLILAWIFFVLGVVLLLTPPFVCYGSPKYRLSHNLNKKEPEEPPPEYNKHHERV